MDTSFLKQAEIFVFIAVAFLLIAVKFSKENNENPPIIVLAEDNTNYRFASGSANLGTSFRNKLTNEIALKIDSITKTYNCNAIQIIGHTSGKSLLQNATSNLDRQLLNNIYSNVAVSPGSNIDLGMMRAVAVMKVLKNQQSDNRLAKIKYWLPYSAGQVVKTNSFLVDNNEIANDLQWDDPKRRRIEIRLFRLK